MPAGALQAAADQAERFDRMKYGEFWPRYLEAHADRHSRALHYLSTSAALACIAGAAIAGDWRWLVAAPIVGYGPAWLAHAAFERNRPETFSHPIWSLLSDFSHARPVPRWPAGRRIAPGPYPERGREVR
jgi:hypothetical protein